jgi:hypothetical protein
MRQYSALFTFFLFLADKISEVTKSKKWGKYFEFFAALAACG